MDHSLHGRLFCYLFGHGRSRVRRHWREVARDATAAVWSVRVLVLTVQLSRFRGVTGNEPWARAAYNDFFTLWKDADTDIPILKEAKAEYAKLQ
jgi:hypothetical protein